MEHEAAAPDEQANRGRTAALIAAAGLATYLAFVAATRHIFLFDLTTVAPVFCLLIGANLVLAVAVPRWAMRPVAVLVYQTVHVVLLTFVLHQLGGLVMGILLITYAFPLILTEMLHAGGTVFFTANLSAACFAVMAWVENRPLAEVGIDSRQQVAFVVLAFVVLNFLAFYTDRYGWQLRHLAQHLTEKVAERTAELTEVNRELAAKARALEEKQEEVRNFVYTVTHDLKGPLNAILLTADLLLQRAGGSLDAEGREALEQIVRIAGGTEDMIHDLLEMFRITSLPEPAGWVELGGVVDDALEHVRPQVAAKRVELAVGPLPPVWGQPRKLTHAVANLLGNAVKYVPAGRGRVEVSGAVENGHVVVAVRDNGIGIAPAYHRGIFELFGRVPAPEQIVDGESVPGTGVGLAIVKRIVEAHRGTVTVESAPGAGSRFTIRLPAGGVTHEG
ncbi:MAG TPA: ATP-binding protein [Candidatus Binatia bacterium]|nr:ATP-binding protein [Candidatus Binatia bacterium]